MKKRPVIDRFWEKVIKNDVGCWGWNSGFDINGYARIYLSREGNKNTRPRKASRISWEIHNGKIPDGLFVLHKCDNPKCVRPDHLFLGNQFDNMRDCAKKGRVVSVAMIRRTHCKYGHPFDNAIRDNNGHRYCPICRITHNKKSGEERKQRLHLLRSTQSTQL